MLDRSASRHAWLFRIVGAIGFLAVSLGTAGLEASIQYQFSGTVPAGTSSLPQVGELETWTATFVIDDSVIASSTPTYSLYSAAVLSGTLEFSGGHISPLDFIGSDLYIFDDHLPTGPDGPVDAVYIVNSILGVSFQAVTTSNPFASHALPLPGAGFNPTPSPTATNFQQLSYNEGVPGEDINYLSNRSNNVIFAAIDDSTGVVPEPMSAVVWTLLAVSLVAGGVSRSELMR